MRARSALLCIGSSLAAVAMSVAPVNAAPEHGVDHDDFSFTTDDLCGEGLTADGHVTATHVWHVRSSKSGAPLFFDNFVGTTTWTVGDRTATITFAGPSTDQRIVDNGDGTITLTHVNSGLIGVLRDASGEIVQQERGRIAVELVIDLNGTPADPDDDTVLSETTLPSHGLMSDAPLCDVLVEVLYG